MNSIASGGKDEAPTKWRNGVEWARVFESLHLEVRENMITIGSKSGGNNPPKEQLYEISKIFDELSTNYVGLVLNFGSNIILFSKNSSFVYFDFTLKNVYYDL